MSFITFLGKSHSFIPALKIVGKIQVAVKKEKLTFKNVDGYAPVFRKH